MTPSATKQIAEMTKNTNLLSPAQIQREMMIMRETDQWMVEHYKNRA
jgi:hypothetical protein